MKTKNDMTPDEHARKTKRYVILAISIMILLSIYVAWTMSQNYRKDDTKVRYELTKKYKDLKDFEYKRDITRGYTLFQQLCAKCHGASGQGIQGRYPPLANSDLVTGDMQKTIKVLLHGLKGEIIRNGNSYNGVMAGYKNIDPVDMAHLLNYIRNSFGNKSTIIHPVEVVKTHVSTIGQKTGYTEKEIQGE